MLRRGKYGWYEKTYLKRFDDMHTIRQQIQKVWKYKCIKKNGRLWREDNKKHLDLTGPWTCGNCNIVTSISHGQGFPHSFILNAVLTSIEENGKDHHCVCRSTWNGLRSWSDQNWTQTNRTKFPFSDMFFLVDFLWINDTCYFPKGKFRSRIWSKNLLSW